MEAWSSPLSRSSPLHGHNTVLAGGMPHLCTNNKNCMGTSHSPRDGLTVSKAAGG